MRETERWQAKLDDTGWWYWNGEDMVNWFIVYCPSSILEYSTPDFGWVTLQDLPFKWAVCISSLPWCRAWPGTLIWPIEGCWVWCEQRLKMCFCDLAGPHLFFLLPCEKCVSGSHKAKKNEKSQERLWSQSTARIQALLRSAAISQTQPNHDLWGRKMFIFGEPLRFWGA